MFGKCSFSCHAWLYCRITIDPRFPSLRRRDGARRVISDQENLGYTKREAVRGISRVAYRVRCIVLRIPCEAGSLAFR